MNWSGPFLNTSWTRVFVERTVPAACHCRRAFPRSCRAGIAQPPSRVAGSGALRPASPLGLPASRGSHGAGAPDGTGLKSLFCPARAALETTAFAPRIRTRPPSRRPPRLRPPRRARTRMRHLGRPPWTPRRRGNAQRGARARSGVRTPRASSARSPRRCGHRAGAVTPQVRSPWLEAGLSLQGRGGRAGRARLTPAGGYESHCHRSDHLTQRCFSKLSL